MRVKRALLPHEVRGGCGCARAQGTMGTPNNHNASKYYSVVDRVIVAPDMTGHFSEKLLYMPHSYQVSRAALTAWRSRLGGPGHDGIGTHLRDLGPNRRRAMPSASGRVVQGPVTCGILRGGCARWLRQVNNLRIVEQRAPEGVATRASERLPEEAFVFAHFNTLRKVLELLARSTWKASMPAPWAAVLSGRRACGELVHRWTQWCSACG